MKYFLSLVSTVILFSGCRKFQEFIDHHTPKPPAAINCRLDSIYPTEPRNPVLHRATAVGVHYNNKGNPILANYTFEHYGVYHIPVHFIYDEKDRLIEILPIMDSITNEELYTNKPDRVVYVYEGNSRLPVRDTVFRNDFTWGNEIEELYYDAEGRVNRVFRQLTTDAAYDLETKYTYDANGNKQVTLDIEGKTPPPLEYSDKPSLYSLNPVWQLIHKDWSKNSLKVPVKTVTAQGLPETLEYNMVSGYYGYPVHDAAWQFNLFLGVESAVALKYTYTCSGGEVK